MPSILITNQFLAGRTGSELHVLELAGQFRNRGWQVTCFTIAYGYPLQKSLEAIGVKVILLGSEHELEDYYDLFLAQHRTVSEHIWNIPRISFGKVIVSILGILDAVEQPPCFVADADGLVFVSEEARDEVLTALPYLNKPSLVFPNYAAPEYFEAAPRLRPSLARIAIISNHPPQELFGLAPLAKRDAIHVDIFGTETTSVEVTPSLLSSYDVVITIGRTTQLCLAAGVPVYCYDRFGGPGYITKANVRLHERFNFSGRSEPTRLNAPKLYANLVSGYGEAVQDAVWLRDYARNHFSLERLFDRLISFVNALSPQSKQRISKGSDWDTLAQDFISCFKSKAEMSRLYGTAQIYYTDNSGLLSEDRSISISYRYGTSISLEFSDLVPEGFYAARFDPDRGLCVCRVAEGSVCAQNRVLAGPSGDLFLTIDPRYDISPNIKRIVFSARPVNEDDLTMATKPNGDDAPRSLLNKLRKGLAHLTPDRS